ncbi:MAG: NAD(P)-dependent oxidoreductase [Candidatus Krumholzibacteriia bacterium]
MKIALIGAGLMGRPMAARLLDAGHAVTAFTRTAGRLGVLKGRGAVVAPSGPAALAAAEVALLMLRDGPAVESTLFGGAEQPDFRGRTVIQMGTIAPGESLELHRRVTAGGGDYLEAPVLGSIPQVEAGQLAVLVGATEAQFARWEPLLKTFGPRPRLLGPVGQAALAKLAFNQIMASQVAAFSLALGLVRRSGLDPGAFMEILRGTVLYAPVVDRKLDLLQRRAFADPHFTTSTLLKDVDLMLDASRAAGLDPVALEGVRAALARAVETGHADEDYASMYEVIDPRS